MDDQDDVAMVVERIAAAAAGVGDLDAAIADLRRLPPGVTARCRLAAGLIEAMMRTGQMPPPHRWREIDYLLEQAETDPPATLRWIRARTMARVISLMREAMEREMPDPGAALVRLEEINREGGGDPALEPLFDGARAGLNFARSVRNGDPGAIARLPADTTAFLDRQPRQAETEPLRELLVAASRAMDASQSGGDVTDGLREMQRAAARMRPGDPMRDLVAETVSALDALTAKDVDGETRRVSDDELAALVALAERSGLGGADRAIYHAQAGMAAMRGGLETSLDRVNIGVDHLRRAVELSATGDPQQVFHLTGLALFLTRRDELTNRAADRREARTLLLQARDLAGGPADPQWQKVNEMLAENTRLLGEDPDSHLTALEGLRGHIWKVLVQPDLAGAIVAARGVAADAVDISRRCLSANDPASAISALDAGRGLALFAATGIRTVDQRLDEAGEPALARRWRAAAAANDPDQLPRELRREVLTVLAAHGSTAALLDPPDIAEIRDALAAIDADALVYLVPGAGALPGYAVMAAASGPPSYMALPVLTSDGIRGVEPFLTALARRDAVRNLSDAEPDDDPDPDTAANDDSLADLCGWAWGAAIGPLVETYLPRLPRPASDRPYRVVLVPMGELARIPWQAARRPDGKYAVQLIAISQAASARMLIRSAALPPVLPSPAGLIVGDPATFDPVTSAQEADLVAARLEAYAIRQTFYPTAPFVGRRPNRSVSPSGEGTVDQVREWLTTAKPAAGAMLHLACHGVVRPGTDHPTAYLVLAGGKRLTAEELVALMEQAPHRAIGLVVLAACRTGISITGYDEAYSLGTAFLASGVRSVLSTQWSIPDEATSALMYMFHHYMRAGDLPVWAALRAAQLWMIDPARVFPSDMPEPLRQRLKPDDLDTVTAWAAFVHWGR